MRKHNQIACGWDRAGEVWGLTCSATVQAPGPPACLGVLRGKVGDPVHKVGPLGKYAEEWGGGSEIQHTPRGFEEGDRGELAGKPQGGGGEAHEDTRLTRSCTQRAYSSCLHPLWERIRRSRLGGSEQRSWHTWPFRPAVPSRRGQPREAWPHGGQPHSF